ncbi:SLC13 family permease [Ferrimonas lipolytica]|uniref:Citrate transporter-like domain-containing protein n=1 Tax=Ferrimonas lipolytica TaxID=2724191 RepID=A0A6H1UEW3_9GAMM|nr:SLC13 family permease [Ferrimonas lipolytica]QIZ77621.1 hypothetical protein HER31_12390 [Ferrimonas lipolytica]
MRHWLLFLLLLLPCSLWFPSLALPQQGLALFGLAGVLWTTHILPEQHSALLIPVIALTQGLLPTEALLEIALAPIMAVFVFGFAFAALSRHQGLDRVILATIAQRSNGSERRACFILFCCTFAISMWTSNVVTAALILPLALMMTENKSLNYRYFICICIAYSATIGGMATQVGSSTSFIASNLIGIDFIGWMQWAMPISLLLWLLSIGLTSQYFKPEFGNDLSLPKLAIEPQQKLSLLIVCTTLTTFVFTAIFWREGKAYWGLIPLVGVLLMMAFKLLSLKLFFQSVKYRVLLIFVSAITLGTVLHNSGGGQLMVDAIMPTLTQLPLPLQLGLVLLFAAIVTELMSNVACASLMAPLLSLLLLPQGATEEQLALLVGMGCSFAFVLSTGTPSNSLVVNMASIPTKVLANIGWKVKLSLVTLLWAILLLH